MELGNLLAALSSADGAAMPRRAGAAAAAAARVDPSVRALLAPLLAHQQSGDMTPEQAEQILNGFQAVWRRAGSSPDDLLTACMAVLAEGSAEQGLACPRRVAVAARICSFIVTDCSKADQSLDPPLCQALVVQMLSLLRRWYPSAGPLPADDETSGPVILSSAGHTLRVLVPRCSGMAAGLALVAAQPVDLLLETARSGPAGLLAAMEPLGALVSASPDWAVQISRDERLILAAFESAQRGEQLPTIDIVPGMAFLAALVGRGIPAAAASALLRLPGLVPLAMDALEKAAAASGDSPSDTSDAPELNYAIYILARLRFDNPAASDKAAAAAMAVQIAETASARAAKLLLSLMARGSPPVTAANAARIIFNLCKQPASLKPLLRTLHGPGPIVAAVLATLRHPELQTATTSATSAAVREKRHAAAATALRALGIGCAVHSEFREGVRRELYQQPLPRATIERAAEVVAWEAQRSEEFGLRFADMEVQYVLGPIIARCVHAGKLQALRPVVFAVAAVLQAAAAAPASAPWANDVEQMGIFTELLGTTAMLVQGVEASNAPAPWGIEALEGLLQAVRRASVWFQARQGSHGDALMVALTAPMLSGKIANFLEELRASEAPVGGRGAASGGASSSTGMPAASPPAPPQPAAAANTPVQAAVESNAQPAGLAAPVLLACVAAATGSSAVPPPPAVAAVCGHCGATAGPQGAKLKLCRGCRAVRYCGQVCADAAWRSHKRACKAAVKAAAAAAAAGEQ